jgi:hypothetical protein
MGAKPCFGGGAVCVEVLRSMFHEGFEGLGGGLKGWGGRFASWIRQEALVRWRSLGRN